VAVAAALAAGYLSASFAVSNGAAAAGPFADTSPPTETVPEPDPAPPAPKPTPKPAAKPPPKPASHPATVYHAPAAPAPSTTYTPTRVTPKATTVRNKKKRHQPAKHVSIAPKPQAQVKHANVERVGVVPTANVATGGSDEIGRTLVIAGIGFAALLFLLVVTVPATGIRFTAPGRVVMDHQTDLVLAGVGTLLLTVLLFALTGIGS
jgi:hypothetical protein